MVRRADLKGEGGQTRKEEGATLPVLAHTHTLALSLARRETVSAFTGLGCQVALFSFYSAPPSSGPASQSFSSRKENLGEEKEWWIFEENAV